MRISFLILALLLKLNSFAQAEVKDSTSRPDTSTSKSIQLSDDDLIFMKCEVEASIDPYVWQRHQDKKIKKFLKESGRKQKIPEGTYTIAVKFLVEKNGSVADVQALNDPGHGLKQLAEDICKTSPKWKPGKQRNYTVRSYKTEYIVLDVID